MNTIKVLFAGAILLVPTVGEVAAQSRRNDADVVYQGRMTGTLRPLRAIENSVVPGMKSRGADYIGAEYDEDMGRYRLKFMRSGSVIWVDVDGRTGAVVGRAGD